MKTHKFMNMNPLMMTIVLTTPLGVVSSNSWISIWILMEVNNLSFTSIENSKTNTNKESMMKYFLIQGISSSIMVTFMMLTNMSNKLFLMMAMSMLMLKMASAPMHQWFLEIVKNMEIYSSTMAMTWQKLIPLSIAFCMKSLIISLFILITSMVGSLLQMKTKDPLEIIGASSIFNNGWSLLSTKTSILVSSMFILIYWSTVWMTTMTMKKDKILEPTKWKEKPQMKWKLSLVMANIGGFPPTAGFAAKAWLTTNLMKKKTSLLVLLIISATSINLYSYTKMFMNSSSSKKANKTWNTKDKFSNTKIIMSSVTSMFLIST